MKEWEVLLLQLLAGLGMAIFIGVSLVVGIRLVRLARRTGEGPELLIGVALLSMGPVSFPVARAALGLQESAPGLAAGMLAFSVVTLGMGGFCVAELTRRVFRPDRAWARLLVWGTLLGLVSCWGITAWKTGFDLRGRPMDWPGYAGFVLRSGALAWTALESLRYWRLMRRRLAIGLADPATTNRFLLWGAGSAAGALNHLVVMWTAGAGSDVLHISDGLALAVSAMGLGTSVCLWLGFLPPQRYLTWLRPGATE